MIDGNVVFWVLIGYCSFIFFISYFTSRGATLSTFFSANKKSPWFLVAFGMIGATLSGITFISVPGSVKVQYFSYLPMVFGYVLGYALISSFLLPLYYKLNVTSIYTYLEERLGFWGQKTGAFFFLISRAITASLQIYIAVTVLHFFVLKDLGISFIPSLLIILIIVWLYTFRGGINTVVWTDVLQTVFMISTAIAVAYFIIQQSSLSFSEALVKIQNSGYSKAFFWEIGDKHNFFKQFFGGVFITVVMTGLDQSMMQKNLTCKNLSAAQKNMSWFSILLVFVNVLFLFLGALLLLYSNQIGVILPEKSDLIFPMLVKNHMTGFLGILFLLGILAATFSSADSAFVSLTTSFCIDFLDFDKTKTGEALKRKKRIQVQLLITGFVFIVILIFKFLNQPSILNALFTAVGYTYGPILGMFLFCFIFKRKVRDGFIPIICILSPVITFILDFYSKSLFGGYVFGYELILVNGLITFLGLLSLIISKPKS